MEKIKSKNNKKVLLLLSLCVIIALCFIIILNIFTDNKVSAEEGQVTIRLQFSYVDYESNNNEVISIDGFYEVAKVNVGSDITYKQLGKWACENVPTVTKNGVTVRLQLYGFVGSRGSITKYDSEGLALASISQDAVFNVRFLANRVLYVSTGFDFDKNDLSFNILSSENMFYDDYYGMAVSGIDSSKINSLSDSFSFSYRNRYLYTGFSVLTLSEYREFNNNGMTYSKFLETYSAFSSEKVYQQADRIIIIPRFEKKVKLSCSVTIPNWEWEDIYKLDNETEYYFVKGSELYIHNVVDKAYGKIGGYYGMNPNTIKKRSTYKINYNGEELLSERIVLTEDTHLVMSVELFSFNLMVDLENQIIKTVVLSVENDSFDLDDYSYSIVVPEGKKLMGWYEANSLTDRPTRLFNTVVSYDSLKAIYIPYFENIRSKVTFLIEDGSLGGIEFYSYFVDNDGTDQFINYPTGRIKEVKVLKNKILGTGSYYRFTGWTTSSCSYKDWDNGSKDFTAINPDIFRIRTSYDTTLYMMGEKTGSYVADWSATEVDIEDDSYFRVKFIIQDNCPKSTAHIYYSYIANRDSVIQFPSEKILFFDCLTTPLAGTGKQFSFIKWTLSNCTFDDWLEKNVSFEELPRDYKVTRSLDVYACMSFHKDNVLQYNECFFTTELENIETGKNEDIDKESGGTASLSTWEKFLTNIGIKESSIWFNFLTGESVTFKQVWDTAVGKVLIIVGGVLLLCLFAWLLKKIIKIWR